MALVRAALAAGAQVKLVAGQVSVPFPQSPRLTVIPVESTADMLAAVQKEFASADALIMAAAVADFKPVTVADQKVKKTADHQEWRIELTETTDILKTVAHHKHAGQIVIGFAAETQHLLANAQKKLASKGADMIVANQVSGNNGAFGNDEDQVTILRPNRQPDKWQRMTKETVAQRLIDLLAKMKSGD